MARWNFGVGFVSKQNLRKHFRQELIAWRETSEFKSGQCQTELFRHLTGFLKKQKGVWCVFKALADEPDLSEVIKANNHIEWAYPVVVGDGLEFRTPQNERFVEGAWGTLHPDPKDSLPRAIHDIHGFLIPGRAFDVKGGRLGRGKSFYDRVLKNYPGLKVGVCYSAQLSQTPLPLDPWDVLMDYVITEKAAIICRSK